MKLLPKKTANAVIIEKKIAKVPTSAQKYQLPFATNKRSNRHNESIKEQKMSGTLIESTVPNLLEGIRA
jgi:hypothetical protein